ncbi:MAG: hypothetical protein NZ938_04015 [Aigarchaeota archaeon]|nr:hypothetical protein [Candidatus Calditenuaceae archaeon]
MGLVWELRKSGRAELARELVELVKDVCPPGVEWGFELARLPGVSYIAENGRVLALSISRGEFGPFMDTRIREVSPANIPAEALSGIVSDPEGFLESLIGHLTQWLKNAHVSNPLSKEVEAFIKALSEKK